MIKNYLYIFFLSTLLFYSCKKINSPEDYQKLFVSLPDTVMVTYDSILQFNATPQAQWLLNDTLAGKIDVNGKYKAGSTDGIYKLIVKNSILNNDSVIKTIIVSQHANTFRAMQFGGYLLSFKYVDATRGTDQITSSITDWWKSCNPLEARQLSDSLGYKQSDSIGKVLRLLKLPFDTSMSSEYCRCKQTLEYFNLNIPIKTYKALTYFVYNEATRYDTTIKLYASRVVNNKNYLAVTHSNFTTTPTVAPLNNLSSGDCALFKLNNLIGTAPSFIKFIRLKDWLALAK